MVFTTLAHLMDVELLREAYERMRKDSSPGVRRSERQEYGEQLEANLNSFVSALRSQQVLCGRRSTRLPRPKRMGATTDRDAGV